MPLGDKGLRQLAPNTLPGDKDSPLHTSRLNGCVFILMLWRKIENSAVAM